MSDTIMGASDPWRLQEEALASGLYVAAPAPYVIGTGLEYIQAGFDAQIKGVSARKVVVSL